jgi:hypothetical protein
MRLTEVESPSDVPRFTEPCSLKPDAGYRFRSARSPDDREKAGLAELGKRWA